MASIACPEPVVGNLARLASGHFFERPDEKHICQHGYFVLDVVRGSHEKCIEAIDRYNPDPIIE